MLKVKLEFELLFYVVLDLIQPEDGDKIVKVYTDTRKRSSYREPVEKCNYESFQYFIVAAQVNTFKETLLSGFSEHS